MFHPSITDCVGKVQGLAAFCVRHTELLFIMQVYNETIRDLLMPGQPLTVREDPQRGVCVSGLTLHKVFP